MENITLIIAIIGCITGITGVILHFYSFLLTRPRIKLEIDQTKPSYLFSAKHFKVVGYKTNQSAVISLKISNASSHPVTINDLTAFNKKKLMRHDERFKFHLYLLLTFRSSEITFKT